MGDRVALVSMGSPVFRTVAAGTGHRISGVYFLFDSLSAMAVGKQKRGSNEGRCGIIRGLKSFEMGNSATQER
jgi:hypothetical protein